MINCVLSIQIQRGMFAVTQNDVIWTMKWSWLYLQNSYTFTDTKQISENVWWVQRKKKYFFARVLQLKWEIIKSPTICSYRIKHKPDSVFDLIFVVNIFILHLIGARRTWWHFKEQKKIICCFFVLLCFRAKCVPRWYFFHSNHLG